MKKKNAFKTLAACSLLTGCLVAVSCGNNKEPDQPKPDVPVVPEVTVDKLALERKIEYVTNNYIPNEAKYTKETFDALKLALEEAQKVNANKDATQTEVDTALEALTKAADGLVSVIAPSKSLDDIASWMEDTEGNYTLTVTDSFSDPSYKENPHTYKVLSDGVSVYDEELKKGITQYDGYVHEFTTDEENKVVMGRKHLGEGLFPSRLLKDTEFDRVTNIMGISEPFTSFGFPVYGFFDQVTGTTQYRSDNSNFFDFYLNLTYGRYAYSNKVEDMFKFATMEYEDGVFTGTLVDNDDKTVFSFTASNVKETKIADLAEYKTAHPKYATNPVYAPKEEADKIIAAGEKGILVDVYSNRQGKSSQEPNFTITSKNDPENSTYWSSSLGYGLIDDNGTTKNFTNTEGKIKLTTASKIDVKSLDLINHFIANYANYKDASGDDEYYINEITPEIKAELYNFFDLSHLSVWGSEDYFDQKPAAVKASDITNVSMSLNDEGKLTITVWGEKGMLCRGVIKSYKGVTIPELDSLTALGKLNLEAALDTANKTSTEGFEAKSVAAFEIAKKFAAETLANEKAAYNDYVKATELLNARLVELEKSDFQVTANGGQAILDFIDKTVTTTLTDDSGSKVYTTNGYKMVLKEGEKETTYFVNQDYVLNETTQEGLMRFEGIIYSFRLINGRPLALSPVMHRNGWSQNILTVVQKNLRPLNMLFEYDDFVVDKHLARIPNTNAYFLEQVDYANFMTGVDTTNAVGVSLELNETTLTAKLYNGYEVTSDTVTGLDLVSAGRTSVQATATITNVGNAKVEAIDTFLADTTPVLVPGVIEAVSSGISTAEDTYIKVDRYGKQTPTIGNSKFLYQIEMIENEETWEDEPHEFVYTAINGVVKKYELDMTQQFPNLPLVFVEDVVAADGVSTYATLAEAGLDITTFANIKEADLTANVRNINDYDDPLVTFTSRVEFVVNHDKAKSIKGAFGWDETDDLVVSMNANGELIIPVFQGFRFGRLYTVSNNLTEMEDDKMFMIGNMIMMLENPMPIE